MTEEMLKAVLDTANAKTDKDGLTTFPDGRLVTLYAGHDGVPLTISKIDHLRLNRGVVTVRNVKGEHFVLAIEDLFAAALDAGVEAAIARKAGFFG